MDTCKSCRFFEARAKQCRAEPPRVLMMQNDRWVSLYPETTRDSWCGRHVRPEESHHFELGSPFIFDKENSHG